MNASSKRRRLAARTILAVGAMTLLLQTATLGHAAPAKPTQDASDATARPPKKSRAVKVKPQQNHSGESAAERDRRLYRECKGMPNAGACLGYTRR